MDLYNRVRGAIERINVEACRQGHHRGRAWRHHQGGGRSCARRQPDKGLAFDIDNCSVTRLDHFASAGHASWRLPMVNQQPWIADASHAAMHQPAGPEVVPETKLA